MIILRCMRFSFIQVGWRSEPLSFVLPQVPDSTEVVPDSTNLGYNQPFFTATTPTRLVGVHMHLSATIIRKRKEMADTLEKQGGGCGAS